MPDAASVGYAEITMHADSPTVALQEIENLVANQGSDAPGGFKDWLDREMAQRLNRLGWVGQSGQLGNPIAGVPDPLETQSFDYLRRVVAPVYLQAIAT